MKNKRYLEYEKYIKYYITEVSQVNKYQLACL